MSDINEEWLFSLNEVESAIVDCCEMGSSNYQSDFDWEYAMNAIKELRKLSQKRSEIFHWRTE